MPRRYNLAPTLGAPMPPHMFGAEAEAGRLAAERRRAEAQRERDRPVTKHPQPHTETVPKSARELEASALAHGFEVRIVFGYWTLDVGTINERDVEAVKVAGLAPKRAGFQAVWVAGKAKIAAWYQPGIEWVGVQAVKDRVKAMP